MFKKLLILTGLVFGPCNAFANDGPPPGRDVSKGWEVNVGAGTLFSPNYLGDDAYSLSAVPYIRATYDDRFFASVQEGMGFTVVANDNFRAGPLVRLDFGRDEDGGGPFRIAGNKTDDLRGLGDIDTTFSIGGFAELDFGGLSASVNVGQAVNGHDGLTGDFGLRFKGMVTGYGPPLIYSIGPAINFGDAKYMSSYFGINQPQSEASGLAVYDASGGIVSYGLSGTAIMPLTQKTSVTLIGNYGRLAGDAASSPLVEDRGSKDQAFLGLVLAYKL